MLLELPDSLVVTSVDAEKHGLVGALARDSSELVALTLWLMAERARGASSPWATLLHTLPEATASPILWEDQVLCGGVETAATACTAGRTALAVILRLLHSAFG